MVSATTSDNAVEKPQEGLEEKIWKGSEMLPERVELEHHRLFCMRDPYQMLEDQKYSKDQA